MMVNVVVVCLWSAPQVFFSNFQIFRAAPDTTKFFIFFLHVCFLDLSAAKGRSECVDALTRGVHNGREISCVYVVKGGGMKLRVRSRASDTEGSILNEECHEV